MKQRACFSLSVACLLALLAVSAPAQDQDLQEQKKKAVEKEIAQVEDAKIRAEMVRVVGEKIGFEMKIVKGAPYSAITEVESVQLLADGNRIRNKTTTFVYRDGEGRTRRESMGKEQSVPTEVFISDPVGHVSYSLDTQRRIAVKSQANLQNIEFEKIKFAIEMEMKERELKRRTQENGQVARDEVARTVKEKPQPITESLGQQVIEGVLCEGRRATTTIPAGAAGNELPINIVNEQWFSPELQVYVMTKQSDPRSGETIYRLTSINRGEPDRALFEVPADYTLKDQSTILPKKKRRPEEEK